MKYLEEIKALLNSLPDKDISLGYKFFELRDFDSLKSLIDSAIFKANKRNTKNDIDMVSLRKLQILVEDYLSFILPEEEINKMSKNIDELDLYE